MLSFVATYRDEETTFTVENDDAVIGRSSSTGPVPVNLENDLAVSRRHARVRLDDTGLYIEDLGSTQGTIIAGKPIAPGQPSPLTPGQPVLLGRTEVRIWPYPRRAETEWPDGDERLRISSVMDAQDVSAEHLAAAGSADASRSLKHLATLPLRFAACSDQQSLCETAAECLLDALPSASHVVVLIREGQSPRDLALKAHRPSGEPPVSTTMAAEVIRRRQACLWTAQNHPETTTLQSVADYHLQSVMAAPLCRQDRILGVLFLANCSAPQAFSPDHLAFLVAFSHYLSLAYVSLGAEERVHRQLDVMRRLLSTFSPNVRERLIEKARRGRLIPGGEVSEVTILSVDIRNYSLLSAEMDAQEILELLNDYFPLLSDCILARNGTVDKLLGDAIIAVFGSPEPDPKQHENALRAALDMQTRMESHNRQRSEAGARTCTVGVGIHCGRALHGFVGSRERLDFTVIGDAVNRTCRYCDAAGGGEILISPDLYQHVWRHVRVKQATVTTKHGEEFPAFRILGSKHADEDPEATLRGTGVTA